MEMGQMVTVGPGLTSFSATIKVDRATPASSGCTNFAGIFNA
jgi:hypothetical protein